MRTGLVLGLDGAGKTLLLRQLTAQVVRKQKTVLERIVAFATHPCGGSSSSNNNDDDDGGFGAKDGGYAVDANTQPSVGVEHWTLPLDGGRICTLREVGGQLLPMWPSYFESCYFWLFLIDASNATQLAAAAVEFFSVLSVDEMRRKPKLLLINQIDAGFVVDDTVLRTYLCLDRLLVEPDCGPVQILKTSALTGENVEQVLKWLTQTVGTSHFTGNNSGIGGLSSISGRYRTAGRQNSGSDIRVHPVAD
ncbi:GTP-binding ADP-ribosylation factor-like protein ARL1 [Phytophthora cinnamomi]|uniref:GTP-binding ADP-ribosylation factor-like protein ARL1 n=1 Tax=Phytophthora cinnamomi TaxID=4785 RepID=UPI00355A9E86|nr:GTP-binding ADP-ribosylation factor-like protein ARL1 [Phytophthora cinnamomi]